MINRSVLLIFIVLVPLLSFWGCKKGTEGTKLEAESHSSIRVGEVETLTGGEAGIGTAIHQGIELGIQKINEKGGINGRKIELITLDDQGRPEEAATAVTKLITQQKVSALLGASASSRSIAIAAIAQKFQIPMITPTSTHPKVTEMGNFIFRVCFIDSFQGKVMADFASSKLKAKKVAVFTDLKSDYSVGLSEFFAQTLKKDGGAIVVQQSYSAGDVDFKSQLTAMRTKNPEAIFIPGYYSDVALIARQARELGIKVPLLGGDGWSSPKLLEIGGASINNSYFSSHFSSESQQPEIQNFVRDFKSKFGLSPNGLSALGYDAAGFLGEGMRKSKNGDSLKLRETLAAMKDYPGVTGKISMNPDRNVSKSAVILKINEGRIQYEK